MKTFLPAVLLLFLPFLGIHAQEVSKDSINIYLSGIKGDSAKIDFLQDQSWSYARINPQYSLELLAMMNEVIESSNTSYKEDVLYYYYGIIYKNLGLYEKSEQYFKKYRDFHQAKNNQRHLAVVTMALANLYSDQGLWSKSMNEVTESLRINEGLKDTLGIIRASSKLGFLLGKLHRDLDALVYHQNAFSLSVALSDANELAIACSNIGATFESLNQLDSALSYFQQADSIDQHLDYAWGQVYDKSQLGRIYLKLDQMDLAEYNANQAHSIALSLGAPNLISMSQLLLGNIKVRKGQISQGIELIEEILGNEVYSNSLNDVSEAHESLYEAYKIRGNDPKALFHLEENKRLSDTLLNQDITNQISGLEIVYQTERKEREINQLNAENKAAQLRLRLIRGQAIGLGIIALLISGFLIWLYRLNRKINHQNDVIQKALNEKDVLLREIHHRVKNNLQLISSLLNLQSRHISDQKALTALKEGQNRVKSMALIHQNLYQEENLTGIPVQEYFQNLTRSLFDSYNISSDKINLIMDIHDVQLDVDTIIPLGLIVNELISNALKYAFPDDKRGSIKVKLTEVDSLLLLTVADDGIGINQETIDSLGQSFGYRLIGAFQTQLEAELDIDGKNGTMITMKIKDYKKVA